MPTLNASLPDEPIFHHAEPKFAFKLNQLVEAVREIQDHINGEDAEEKPDEKLTASQKRAKAKAEAEAQAKLEADEAAVQAARDADENKQR